MKLKFLLIAFLFPICFFSQITGKIIKIKDGDTVVVLLDDNTQKTLRLAEVDCPENGQPFGKNAKQFTANQVFRKNVVYNPVNTDRYGRTIAKIYYDNGKYLSAEIIKAGLGWWYFRYSDNKDLEYFEKQARDKKIGLWQDKNAISPWTWRTLRKK